MKKHIKVKFVKCPFFENNIRSILEKYYDVEDSENPEYAFFDYLNYEEYINYHCIRILYIGENIRPDFNLFDYAISFDDIDYDSRNLHLPIYAIPQNWERHLNSAITKNSRINVDEAFNRKFCCFIVSNGSGANGIREKMYKRLSEYRQIDSAGRFMNNMPNHWNVPGDDTKGFASQYKFQLCFENSSYKGYTTEKIFNAWGAGTIPIYWGDPTIGEIFNPEAFVWLHDTSDKEVERVVEQIKMLDQDKSIYDRMLKEPIFKGEIPEFIRKDRMERFIRGIIDQPYSEAYKRTNSHDGYGYYYERDTRKHILIDKTLFGKIYYKYLDYREKR